MLCVLNRPPYANRRQCPQDSGAQRRYGCRTGHSRRTDGSWRRICPYGRAAKGKKALKTTKKAVSYKRPSGFRKGISDKVWEAAKKKGNTHYRPELPSSNRGHTGEVPDDVYYGQ